MYTRSRNSQGYGNGRGQPNNPNSGSQYQNSTYTPQTNFVPAQMTGPGNNQQGNFNKPNIGQNNQPFKPSSPAIQQQNRPVQGSPMVKQMIPQQVKPVPQSQTATPTPPPQQARLKPILKQTSTPSPVAPGALAATPAAVPAPTPAPTQAPAPAPTPAPAPAPAVVSTPPAEVIAEGVEDAKETMEVDNQEQPKWKRSRVPGYKVNKKLKRLRMNQRIRRALQPKNAIMVLNEMKTGVSFTFPESQPAMPNSLFVVHAEIEGKTYVGQGLSKPLARQNAAENALKCLLLEKMTTATSKAQIDAESDEQQSNAMDSSAAPPTTPATGKDEAPEGELSAPNNPSEEQDEVPWSSLASFALYKLFLEWQNQGTVVPVPRPGLAAGRAKREPKAPVEKVLPTNAISIHPVMLLNQMKPGLTYVEVSRVGNPPNTMFTLAVEIDGVDYNGSAKNKKDAKKMAAKTALNALYGLVYPEESKMDHTEDIVMC